MEAAGGTFRKGGQKEETQGKCQQKSASLKPIQEPAEGNTAEAETSGVDGKGGRPCDSSGGGSTTVPIEFTDGKESI